MKKMVFMLLLSGISTYCNMNIIDNDEFLKQKSVKDLSRLGCDYLQTWYYTEVLQVNTALENNQELCYNKIYQKGGISMYNPQLETFLKVADCGSFNKAAEVFTSLRPLLSSRSIYWSLLWIFSFSLVPIVGFC